MFYLSSFICLLVFLLTCLAYRARVIYRFVRPLLVLLAWLVFGLIAFGSIILVFLFAAAGA